jgi:hypothetical protein
VQISSSEPSDSQQKSWLPHSHRITPSRTFIVPPLSFQEAQQPFLPQHLRASFFTSHIACFLLQDSLPCLPVTMYRILLVVRHPTSPDRERVFVRLKGDIRAS